MTCEDGTGQQHQQPRERQENDDGETNPLRERRRLGRCGLDRARGDDGRCRGAQIVTRGGRRNPGPGKSLGRPPGSTSPDRLVQRTVQLTPEQHAAVQALAKRHGIKYNEVFREVTDRGLAELEKIDTL